MIGTLHIKNIGIIDDITIDLSEGFNVLTGETGAGKTLIIDSLNLACGGRFSREIIRHGEDSCLVELNMFFQDNNELKVSENDEVIVTREVFSNGRNNCKINGRLVTVNELKEFMKSIIDIHGQNDNQTIMQKSAHIKYLDNYIGKDIKNEKEEYIGLYNRYNQIKNELKQNYGDDKERQRRLDLLNYQLNEIDAASLRENEDEDLENEKKKIINAEKIYTAINEADNYLSEMAIDGISSCIKSLEKIEDIDESYKEKLNSLKNVYYDIQEIARDISGLNNEVYYDEDEIKNVEDRLDAIYDLKRKYGNTIPEIMEYRNQIEKEIYNINNLESRNIELKNDLDKISQKMLNLCRTMNQKRVDISERLSDRINKELAELEMKNAHFSVKIEYDEGKEFEENGLDDVEFMIATNIGDEAKSLIRIASGGEISRIMLAIKTVFADTDEVPIIVFDEIDTGISGKAAKAVGEKIKIISQKHQVLCITHQANIAARGDSNYYISKSVENGKTYTNIKLLNEAEVIEEIARISSGDITESALNHAKEMRYLAS